LALSPDDNVLAAGCDNGDVLIFMRRSVIAAAAAAAAAADVTEKKKNGGMRTDSQTPTAGGEGDSKMADDGAGSTSGGSGNGGGGGGGDDGGGDPFSPAPVFVLKPGGAVSISTVLSVTSVTFSSDGRYVRAECNGGGSWSGTMHRVACFAPVLRVWDLQVRRLDWRCGVFASGLLTTSGWMGGRRGGGLAVVVWWWWWWWSWRCVVDAEDACLSWRHFWCALATLT
jgi:hypothetical protein